MERERGGGKEGRRIITNIVFRDKGKVKDKCIVLFFSFDMRFLDKDI